MAPGPTILFLQLVDWVYEQRIPPWQPYFGLLDKIHQHLVPRTYAEIGVSLGRSLTLALPGTVSIGVDPAPNLQFPLRRGTRIFNQTSDDFFAQHDLRRLFGGLPLDLGFIDGMHRFEFALRDFINFERASSPGTVLLIHDCLPVDELSAARDQATTIWSGDVWRLILLLRERRPDLDISVIDIAPTGLGLVRRLDPHSTVLSGKFRRHREPLHGHAVQRSRGVEAFVAWNNRRGLADGEVSASCCALSEREHRVAQSPPSHMCRWAVGTSIGPSGHFQPPQEGPLT